MSDTNMVCGLGENFEFLINELTSQQKQQQKTTSDLVSAVNSSSKKVENLDSKIEQLFSEQSKKLEETISQKLDSLSGTNQTVDTSSLKTVLQKSMSDIKLMIAAYPKSNTKKFQILLFPEQDAKLFYKIVFGRWFIWLAVILLLSFAYKYTIHHDDNNKQLTMEAFKNDKITKAWDYLYSQKDKQLHRLMDSAMKKADTLSR